MKIVILTSTIVLFLGSGAVLGQTLKGYATSKANRELGNIKVNVALVEPRTASDVFGRRIARRFIVFQVTIGNGNENFDYWVQDVLLRVPITLIGKKECPQCCSKDDSNYTEISSLEPSILRGVAERGRSEDRRNVLIRIATGIGNIATGLTGITQFGSSYVPTVAAFNGPLLTSVENIFPDHGINHVKNLNTAGVANRIVPQSHSMIMFAFVPQTLFFSKKDSKGFWKDTYNYVDRIMQMSVRVIGNFVAEVDKVPPTITTIAFENVGKIWEPNSTARGFVIGQFLTDSELSLGTGGEDMKVEIDGVPTNDRIDFILYLGKPVPPNHKIEFIVKKDRVKRKYTATVPYQVRTPQESDTGPDGAAGSGSKELEGDEPELPDASVRESETDS